MKLHSEKQGSPAWVAVRLQHFTASEASAMLGKSKYMKRIDLLKMKATGEREEISKSLQIIFDKGHDSEAKARPVIEKELGIEFCPVVGSLEIEGLPLMSSYDGLDVSDTDIWEHKLFSKWRAEYVLLGNIPTEDKYQLEQQLMVSGAKRVHFTLSNLLPRLKKDRNEPVMVIYESDPAIRQEIIDGWKQFAIDLELYKKGEYKEPEKTTEVAVVLPKISFDITGKVKKASKDSIVKYEGAATEYLKAVNTDLKTDEDFAAAELDYKFCLKVKNEIKLIKEKGIAEAKEISEYEIKLDDLYAKFHKMETSLKALVKSKKDELKAGVIVKARARLTEAEKEAETRIAPYSIGSIEVDFVAATKAKRTLKSLESSVNQALLLGLDMIKGVETLIKVNMGIIAAAGEDNEFLFPDASGFIRHDSVGVQSLVSLRVNEYKEKMRLAEEDQAKIKAEAEADAGSNDKLTFSDEGTGTSLHIDQQDDYAIHIKQNVDPYAGEPDPTEMAGEFEQVDGTAADNVVGIEAPIVDQATRDAKNAAYYSLRHVMGFDSETAKKLVAAISAGLIDCLEIKV